MQNQRMEQLLRLLEQEPDDDFLNYALAMEYVGSENDEEARKVLEKLVVRNPSYTASYYHLGKICLRNGDKNAAQEVFEAGIQITREKKQQHALSELQSALNELLYDDDD